MRREPDRNSFGYKLGERVIGPLLLIGLISLVVWGVFALFGAL